MTTLRRMSAMILLAFALLATLACGPLAGAATVPPATTAVPPTATVRPAVKALLVQLCALAGAPAGMAVLGLLVVAFKLQLDAVWVVLAGGASGLAGGAFVGLLAGMALDGIYQWVKGRVQAWRARRAAAAQARPPGRQADG
jgi:hypothetical protein